MINQPLPETKVDPVTDLFSSIFTKQDLLLFYKEVDQIMTKMFTGKGNFEEILSSIVSPEKKKAVLSFLKQQNVNLKNPVEIKVALSKIQKIGDAVPAVSFILAFSPTEKIIKNMSSWFLKRMGQKVMLDFSLERSVIGGAYISYNGLYKDYTLQTKIEKYFENVH